MRCPTLKELPAPPSGKRGWPWTEETPQLADTTPDGSAWPRISMVTPSYNQGRFIEETIRAVLLQGYPNLEYIIVDDNSPDESPEIIRKYESWIKILPGEENRGMSQAINRGFKECTGEIITWISSDDVYFPQAFYNVASRWPKVKECGAIIGAFHFMDEDSKIDQEKHLPRLLHEAPIDLTIISPEEWRLHQVSTFYLARALDNAGRAVREDLRSNMDRELLYRICKNHKIFLIPEALAAFRIHPKSKSWSPSNMIFMGREFARIQYMCFSNNSRDNAKRKRIARYIIAKGYVKYAKYTPNIFKSAAALIAALFYKPTLAIRKSYITAWLKVLRIRPALKLLKQIFRRYK